MQTRQGRRLLFGFAVCLTAAVALGQDPRYSGNYSRDSHYSRDPRYSSYPSHGSDQYSPVSREEAEDRIRRYTAFLTELDTNHNGILDVEEVSGSRRSYADRLLERANIPANYPIAISQIMSGLQQHYTSRVAGALPPGTAFGSTTSFAMPMVPGMPPGTVPGMPWGTVPGMPWGTVPGMPPGTPPGMPPGTPPSPATSVKPSTPTPVAQPLVPGFVLPANLAPLPGFGGPALSGLVALRGSSSAALSSSSRSGKPSPPPPSSPPAKSEEEGKLVQYAKGLLQQYDKNKNGKLEKEEWSQMKPEYKEADRDGDGVITLEELTGYLARYSRGRRGSDSGSGSSTASGGSDSQKQLAYRFRTALERLPAGIPDDFLRRDIDQDGQVSMGEFLVGNLTDSKAAEFAQYDLNGDGFITASEYLAVEKQRKEKEKEKDRARRGGSRTSTTETSGRTYALAASPLPQGPPVGPAPPPNFGPSEPRRAGPPPPPADNRPSQAAVVIPEPIKLEMASPPPRPPEMRGGERPSPDSRFNEMEKAVGHEPPKGVLTKEEFITSLKQSGSKMADRGAETFDRIKKADPNKVTKDEYVKYLEELFSSGGRKRR